jgi:hypothetical protein
MSAPYFSSPGAIVCGEMFRQRELNRLIKEEDAFGELPPGAVSRRLGVLANKLRPRRLSAPLPRESLQRRARA